jgi:hypothetical protein
MILPKEFTTWHISIIFKEQKILFVQNCAAAPLFLLCHFFFCRIEEKIQNSKFMRQSLLHSGQVKQALKFEV